MYFDCLMRWNTLTINIAIRTDGECGIVLYWTMNENAPVRLLRLPTLPTLPTFLCDAHWKFLFSADDLAYSTEWLIDLMFFIISFSSYCGGTKGSRCMNSTLQNWFDHDLCGRLMKNRYRVQLCSRRCFERVCVCARAGVRPPESTNSTLRSIVLMRKNI